MIQPLSMEDPESTETLTLLRKIQAELTSLGQNRLLRSHNSLPRLIGLQLLKGMASGLGTVLGATVLVSIAIYILSHMNWVPYVGNWIQALIEHLRTQGGTLR